ncbi:hypothetical protein FCM35_KLT08522 [Carex littledalei]|uniref:VOC domain-containing protein n=1 Tax=Carex littledalei TaxID=544730 RepID=A0A833V6Y7_9POAL|nr:hypothetical protein FCM35_KLT08522 [Carex littledalei]
MATQSLYFPTISPVSPISKHQSCAISVKHHCSFAKRRETSRNGRLGKLNVSIESERLQSVERSHGKDYGVVSIHHVGILCENLERSLDFYKDLLGLEVNLARPNDKLPYRGAWLWVGSEMIHLMELPNPDPLTGRPEHGGRDRHTCIAIRDVSKLKAIFDEAGINYTLSRSGRPAIFARDPDGNALEFTQVD